MPVRGLPRALLGGHRILPHGRLRLEAFFQFQAHVAALLDLGPQHRLTLDGSLLQDSDLGVALLRLGCEASSALLNFGSHRGHLGIQLLASATFVFERLLDSLCDLRQLSLPRLLLPQDLLVDIGVSLPLLPKRFLALITLLTDCTHDLQELFLEAALLVLSRLPLQLLHLRQLILRRTALPCETCLAGSVFPGNCICNTAHLPLANLPLFSQCCLEVSQRGFEHLLLGTPRDDLFMERCSNLVDRLHVALNNIVLGRNEAPN
mmetsp:Transcript_21589/g.60313  ORF Transcript_21589/g.60313 Transcript_21589/m.60313 type:complete len:263 (+) Transcript_21589:1961-2749(+)